MCMAFIEENWYKSTHSQSIAPLPAAIVHRVPSIESDPKPVVSIIFRLSVCHIIKIIITTVINLHCIALIL